MVQDNDYSTENSSWSRWDSELKERTFYFTSPTGNSVTSYCIHGDRDIIENTPSELLKQKKNEILTIYYPGREILSKRHIVSFRTVWEIKMIPQLINLV